MQKPSKILILIILFQLTIGQAQIFAHEAVRIGTYITKEGQGEKSSVVKYTTQLETDKPGWSVEGNHLEAKLGDFSDLKTSAKSPFDSGVDSDKKNYLYLDSNKIEESKRRELRPLNPTTSDTNGNNEANDTLLVNSDPARGLIFTFPSKEEGWMGGKNNVSPADADRAFETSNVLTSSLNGILTQVNEGKPYRTEKDLITASIYIRPSATSDSFHYAKTKSLQSSKSFYIVYGTDVTKTTDKSSSLDRDGSMNFSSILNYFPHADKDGNLWAYVAETTSPGSSTIKNGTIAPFIYAIPKGYIPIPNVNGGKAIIPHEYSYIHSVSDEKKADTAWLSVHHLAHQANFAFTQKSLSGGKTVAQQSLGLIEKKVYEFLSSVFYTLRSMLGLYDTEELIFNKGLRGSGLYTDGMMSQDWWTVVLRYHLIFQAIAWSLIIGAITKILIQLNFSTVNPSLRISIQETIAKLFTIGFLLVSIIPITQLFTTFNNSIVEIFSTQVDWSDSARVANHSGLLAGLFIELIYFFINLYLNFVYIMRSIMIAILVASGPFFIVTMAFSLKGKGLFDNWIKELTANVFLQGFHAFAFAFILNVQGASRGIEELAITASLIPLTEFFRTMVLGQSGSFAINQGKMLTNQSVQATAKIGEAFSKSAKNGERHIDGDSNMNEPSTSKNEDLQRNSEKLRENSSSNMLGVVSKGAQKAFDTGLGVMKTVGGITLQNQGLMMDGATDLRNQLRQSKSDLLNSFGNEDIPDWDQNGILLTKETQQQQEIPIRPKEYLNSRGLSITPYGSKGQGKAKGMTLQVSNRGRLSENDLQNIKHFEAGLKNNDLDQLQFRKENGIEDVVFDNQGQIDSISFNRLGMEKMNIDDLKKKDYEHQGKSYKGVLFEHRLNDDKSPIYTFTPTYNSKKTNKDNLFTEKAV